MVRIPAETLPERVLDLAAPLLARPGADAPEGVRSAITLAITFWNAKARASKLWGTPRPKPLKDLQRKMTGKKASPDDAEAFELLLARWHDREFALDPRLVGDWSLEVGDGGQPRLSCEVELPAGVEAHVPPPVEERVAIDGSFLDETRIRLTGTSGTVSLLGFPLQHHWATVGEDGSVTVHTKVPTALALLAEGVLPPIRGAAVALTVQGKKLDAMTLSEIRVASNGGYNDVAVLVFKPASGAAEALSTETLVRKQPGAIDPA